MSSPQRIAAIPSRQFQALLEIAESIAEHRDLTVLFRQLAERLADIISFDSLWLVLHDPAANCMQLHLLEAVSYTHLESVKVPSRRVPKTVVTDRVLRRR